MKKTSSLIVALALILAGCSGNQQEKALQTFFDTYLKSAEPLHTQSNLAYWDAAITGEGEAFDQYGELDYEMRMLHSDPDAFTKLKAFRESGMIKKPVLARQLDLVYNAYLTNQIKPEFLKQIVDQSSKVEKTFSTFRGKINGVEVSNNEIELILKTETDSRKRREAWRAAKQVAPAVAEDIVELVKLRNKAAEELGFENYHTMQLRAGEQDPEDIAAIFDNLYALTEEPFSRSKAELDARLADMYGVGVDGLMPWHYHDPFFQETPAVYELDLDTYYEDKDVVKLAEQYFSGIALPVDAIIAQSDLYERQGKNPHAFCIDIDRQGDVRILCNVANNERWMETMLHELGHAVYNRYMDPSMPWLLREPAHSFTTEAVAMFFGRLSRNPNWMQDMLELTDEQRNEIAATANKFARLKQLIFARWAMVMFNFERQLYANPDQDLNALWWDLVEKYQHVQKPAGRNEPDWAAKIHVALYPAYYHNYLLGELLASQFHHTLVYDALENGQPDSISYVGEPAVGAFFRDNVFEPGNRYPWNEMIVKATGEPLNPQYFVDQFVN